MRGKRAGCSRLATLARACDVKVMPDYDPGVEIPEEWVRVLGGGSQGTFCLVCFENEDRPAASMAKRGDSSVNTLPSVSGALPRAESEGVREGKETLDGPFDGRSASAANAHSVPTPAVDSSANLPAVKKPEPFSMAALIENARRKALEKKQEEEARARGETFQRAASSDEMDEGLRTYAVRQKELQDRLKGLTCSLKKFDVRAAEAKVEHERVRLQARASAAFEFCVNLFLLLLDLC